MSTLSDATEVAEGGAKLQLPPEPRKVFYNPKMSVNRDLAILFTHSYFPPGKEIVLCDPMTGSGVRAIRYVLETQRIGQVVASDRDYAAVELAHRTILLNQLNDRVFVVHSDAYKLLSAYAPRRFDMIDLDPFGSPAPFFESTLRATVDKGIVAATATDMGPLSGSRPRACMRKYGVSPIKAEFEKELAVRTLAASLAAVASKLELGMNIVFSHATDHYARLYAAISKGRKAANLTLRNLGYLTYCPACLFRIAKPAISSIRDKCDSCGATCPTGGPLWLGPLWDKRIVDSMIQTTPTLRSSRLAEVQKILARIQGEILAPKFYFTTGTFSSVYRVKPPSLGQLIDSLRACGYEAARTHFNSTGFRTDASLQTIVDCFRMIAEEA